MYNFNHIKEEIKKTEEWLKSEFGGIRTGRATPSAPDSARVAGFVVTV